MKKTTYRPGDLVRLKSGGPQLTVCDVCVIPKDEWHAERVRIRFQWFTKDGMLHLDETHTEALKPAARRRSRG